MKRVRPKTALSRRGKACYAGGMGFSKQLLVALAVMLGAAAVLSAAARQDQKQEPTFRSATRTVPVYVTVTDNEGRIVPGLVREDFQVADNKRPQPLTLFSNDPQPITAAVLLDTSGSMTNYIDFVKQACEAFLLRLLPKDRAMVGYFNDKISFVSPLTSDRDLLVSSLKRIDYGYPTRLYDAIDLGITELKPLEGRRVIVVFTDGEDQGSKLHFDPVLQRAREEGMMVYGIGLHTRYFDGQRMREGIPDRVLKKIAEETGGGYFELKKTDELTSTFTRVEQELHSQYVLGFTPPELDGKLHTIDVTLVKPGMKARARKNYIATPEKLTENK
ncbi:MAG: VWA domain-containing protein [Bacteroidales bacterium]